MVVGQEHVPAYEGLDEQGGIGRSRPSRAREIFEEPSHDRARPRRIRAPLLVRPGLIDDVHEERDQGRVWILERALEQRCHADQRPGNPQPCIVRDVGYLGRINIHWHPSK